MPRPKTRETIMTAALDCFLERGVAETSIADLRARSGASTGSIYHFFDSKEDIAVVLCAESLASWARAVAAVTAGHTPRETVRAMVSGLIEWAVAHEKQHRFLVEHAYLTAKAAGRSDMVDALMTARLTQERQVRDLIAAGALRPMPWDLARALILGPAEAYLKARTHGEALALPEEAAETLGEAAWRAVASPQALAQEPPTDPAASHPATTQANDRGVAEGIPASTVLPKARKAPARGWDLI